MHTQERVRGRRAVFSWTPTQADHLYRTLGRDQKDACLSTLSRLEQGVGK